MNDFIPVKRPDLFTRLELLNNRGNTGGIGNLAYVLDRYYQPRSIKGLLKRARKTQNNDGLNGPTEWAWGITCNGSWTLDPIQWASVCEAVEAYKRIREDNYPSPHLKSSDQKLVNSICSKHQFGLISIGWEWEDVKTKNEPYHWSVVICDWDGGETLSVTIELWYQRTEELNKYLKDGTYDDDRYYSDKVI